jgi:hypothetical protein
VESSHFIDRLIEDAGWMSRGGEPGDMRLSMREEMEKMLVRPLEELGVLVTERVPERRREIAGIFAQTALVTFSLTGFGGVFIDGL